MVFGASAAGLAVDLGEVGGLSNATVHLAFAGDTGVAMPMAVAIDTALRRLATAGRSAHIHLLALGFEAEAEARLRRLVEGHGAGWTAYLIEPDRFDHLAQVGHVSRATYLRFLLPELLADVERVVYLDADTLVQADLSELYDYPLDGCCLAAVPDAASADEGHFSRLRECLPGEPLALGPRMFNAGVLLIDLSAWRAEAWGPQMLERLVRWGAGLAYTDQDALNAFMGSVCRLLPLHYNVMSLWRTHRPRNSDEADRVAAWMADPEGAEVVWHFAGRTKPWNPQSLRSPFRGLYHRALRDSGWFQTRAAFERWRLGWYTRAGRRVFSGGRA
ncbi:MAG: glycosyltransferase family 8 protein [Planctomycetota bacterium]